MREPSEFKTPKWPFFLGDASLVALAGFISWQSGLPLNGWNIAAIVICLALGATAGGLPFLLEYRGTLRLIEINALGAVSDKISNLERLAAQISSATNQWEITQSQAEKTANTANEIADRMAAEVREFSAFMAKMNESEKGALRLEVEKLHRAEAEWLQVLVRVYDHVFALHAGAVRSGQPGVIAQIGRFQDACRDAGRRVGLAPFEAKTAEPFDPKRHQWADGESPPDGALVSETAAAGYTFQGRLVRCALVRVQAPDASDSVKPEQAPPADSTESKASVL